MRASPTEANVRREAGFVQATRLSGGGEVPHPAGADPAQHHADHDRQMSTHHEYAILNAAGLSFIGLGVRPPDASGASWWPRAPPYCRASGGSRSFPGWR
jgi:peptide/nickel transport system permease protein